MRHPIEIMREMALTDLDHDLRTSKPVRHTPCGTAAKRSRRRKANRLAAASRRVNRRAS